MHNNTPLAFLLLAITAPCAITPSAAPQPLSPPTPVCPRTLCPQEEELQRIRSQNDELRALSEQAREAAGVAEADAAAAEARAAAAEGQMRDLQDAMGAARDAALIDRARLVRCADSFSYSSSVSPCFQPRTTHQPISSVLVDPCVALLLPLSPPLKNVAAATAAAASRPPPRPQEGQLQAKNKLEHEAAERRQKCAEHTSRMHTYTSRIHAPVNMPPCAYICHPSQHTCILSDDVFSSPFCC